GRHLATAVRDRVVEGEFYDACRSHDADVLDRDRGVLADFGVRLRLDDRAHSRELRGPDVELDPGIEVLDVLAHHDEIDVAHRRVDTGVGLRRTQVGVEVELLAQRDVDGAHPGAELRGERAFEAHLVPADRIEGALRECIADLLERGQADVVNVPLDLNAGRFDRAAGRVDDLGTRAVAWDERDAVRQCGLPFACGSSGIVRSGTGHRTALSSMVCHRLLLYFEHGAWPDRGVRRGAAAGEHHARGGRSGTHAAHTDGAPAGPRTGARRPAARS